MNEPSREVRRTIKIVALIYAFNAAVVVANCFDVSKAISDALVRAGAPSVPWLRAWMESWTVGFFYGEIGCIALWANLSTVRLRFRGPIAIGAIVQAVVLLLWIGPWGEILFTQLGITLFISFLGQWCAVLALTFLILKLSAARIRLVEIDQTTNGHNCMRVTISQTLVATTSIAVALVTKSAARTAVDGSVTYVYLLSAISFVGSMGLFPMVGLVVATSIRWFGLQIFACVILSSLASALINQHARDDWNRLLMSMNLTIWLFLLPVIWIRIVRRFGYVVQRVERKEQEEHSFLHTDGGLLS